MGPGIPQIASTNEGMRGSGMQGGNEQYGTQHTQQYSGNPAPQTQQYTSAGVQSAQTLGQNMGGQSNGGGVPVLTTNQYANYGGGGNYYGNTNSGYSQ